MELLDVTVPLRTGMVTYPRNPGVGLERVRAISEGATANLSRLDLGVHSGTHVDAPVHFFEEGGGAETLPLESLLGPAVVVDDSASAGDIDEGVVEQVPEGAERVLFKTRNSGFWALDEFREDFARVTAGGAERLVARGVLLVGVDYLSVGGHDAHRTLLGAGVTVVEGLDLRAVEAGAYRLACLPLRLAGSDGAPARAVLIRD